MILDRLGSVAKIVARSQVSVMEPQHTCPLCREVLNPGFVAAYSGRVVHCPHCAGQLELPAAEPAMPAAAPSAEQPAPPKLDEQVRQTVVLVRLQEIHKAQRHLGSVTTRTPIFVGTVCILLLALCLLTPVLIAAAEGEVSPSMLAYAVIVALVAYAGNHLGVLGRKAELRDARARLNERIAAFVREFPDVVASWGGQQVLWDAEVTAKLIRLLQRQQGGDTSGQKPHRGSVSEKDRRASGQPQPHRGSLILCLGILAWLFPLVGLLAWLMGHNDLREMEAGRMDRAGYSLTNSGKMLGMIATILQVGLLLLSLALAHR